VQRTHANLGRRTRERTLTGASELGALRAVSEDGCGAEALLRGEEPFVLDRPRIDE